ncbi:hypothetical protein KSP39_PZI006866 [Platanthera zijinensis]|uniref:Uncharacterized protein n=1 Tax=Platanthera zijinensis TaxID=2320716 RepID=A0AAP0GAA8_9ASPA
MTNPSRNLAKSTTSRCARRLSCRLQNPPTCKAPGIPQRARLPQVRRSNFSMFVAVTYRAQTMPEGAHRPKLEIDFELAEWRCVALRAHLYSLSSSSCNEEQSVALDSSDAL